MINYIILILSLLYIIYFIEKSFKNKRIKNYFNDFTNYITLLEYYMDKAYAIIYKDRILIYSLEATKFDENEFEIVVKDFITLVLKMLGSNLTNELYHFYGDEDTLFFNMTEFFNTRFEDDEIREQAMENMVDKDLEEQT